MLSREMAAALILRPLSFPLRRRGGSGVRFPTQAIMPGALRYFVTIASTV